ncbi:alpha/beta hydrolase [Hymenobacter sp. 15J16-1T3B]|uniref:alpha/beta hydrolase n=1 Tax=Hymenobacter sp. 15J16-1T3B TaxID=2886941 RepID=UPI001D10BC45|nr:alpha/beta hydrolase [Hymenobacter sp. 15J16-1T3B]MCC3157256.1 alpha/beta hydrolase [Hymenobacter sp. 15J16-1T3B]
MPSAAPAYTPDILGPDFEQLRLEQPADYEGAVVSTLVRHRPAAAPATRRAVLYVHGFTDYFFQRELAEQWTAHGYRFYALDLRKYGRSLLPHQRPNNVRDLREYFADLDAARAIMQAEGAALLVLNGHSTGGLISALHAAAHPGAWAALVLNSPFLEMNQPRWLREGVLPLVVRLGHRWPDLPVQANLPFGYGESLHRHYHGEWDYNLDWKPRRVFNVNAGWLRAIRRGHRQVAQGLGITAPVLVLHSARTVQHYHPFNEEYFQADGVLNVTNIRDLAPRLGPRVTVETIEGGMHDLVLSRPAVRAEVYQRVFEWLAKTLPGA